MLHTEEKPSPTSKVDTGLNFSCSLGSESLHQVDGKNKCETKSEMIEKFEEENGYIFYNDFPHLKGWKFHNEYIEIHLF